MYVAASPVRVGRLPLERGDRQGDRHLALDLLGLGVAHRAALVGAPRPREHAGPVAAAPRRARSCRYRCGRRGRRFVYGRSSERSTFRSPLFTAGLYWLADHVMPGASGCLTFGSAARWRPLGTGTGDVRVPARTRRRALRPDVVAMVTFRDIEDRQWSAAEGLLTPTDRRYRQAPARRVRVVRHRDAHGWRRHGAVRGPADTGRPRHRGHRPDARPQRIEAYRRVLRSAADELHRRHRRRRHGELVGGSSRSAGDVPTVLHCARRSGRGGRATSSSRRSSEAGALLRLLDDAEVRLGRSQPSGNSSLASSSLTEPTMMTSSPCFQLAGVATLWLAVSCSESMTRSTSSKLRPVVIG